MVNHVTDYQRILVAVDFSEQTEKTLARACLIANNQSAYIELVHVVEIPTYPVLEDVAIMGMPGVWDDEVAQSLFSASEQRLEKIAAQYQITKFKTLTGIASVDIAEYAKQHQFDLIVVGAHGLSGINRLIGSTTNAIINHAESDVLAVRP